MRSEPAGRLVHRKLVQRAAVEATHELKVQRALSWAGRDAQAHEAFRQLAALHCVGRARVRAAFASLRNRTAKRVFLILQNLFQPLH